MHQDWAIGILHRHQDIPDGHVMLHEIGDDYDLCKPVRLDYYTGNALSLNSLLLDEHGKFQVFEYDQITGRAPLEDDFLVTITT